MKNSEIKELSNKELLERIDEDRSLLTRLSLNHAISPLESPMKITNTRRNIARLLTEKRKRELSGNKK